MRRGLVNHYFGSKRDLFIEVVREMLGSFGRAFPLPAVDGPLDRVVADHVGRWLDVVEGDAETWFAILGAEALLSTALLTLVSNVVPAVRASSEPS